MVELAITASLFDLDRVRSRRHLGRRSLALERSNSVQQLDDESYRIVGKLMIRKRYPGFALHVVTRGADQDPWGNARVGLGVAGEIDPRSCSTCRR